MYVCEHTCNHNHSSKNLSRVSQQWFPKIVRLLNARLVWSTNKSVFQKRHDPTTDESNHWSFMEFLLFFLVFSPQTQRATMWRHDQTIDFSHIQLCFSPPQTLHASWELTPRNPWHRHRGKTSLHFLFRNRCSVQTSLQRNAKKNVSELPSIPNLLSQISLEFGNCKILVLSMNVSR